MKKHAIISPVCKGFPIEFIILDYALTNGLKTLPAT